MDSYLFVLYDKTLKNGVPPPEYLCLSSSRMFSINSNPLFFSLFIKLSVPLSELS